MVQKKKHMARGLAVRGLTASCESLQAKMQNITLGNAAKEQSIASLQKEILALKTKVKELCRKKQGYPADLPERSYRQYIWLAFMNDDKWLERHLGALRNIITTAKVLGPNPNFQIRFENTSYLFRGAKKKEAFELVVNEGFILADATLYQEIIDACFRNKSKGMQKIRDFSRSAKYKLVMKAMWQHTAQSSVSTKGHYFNLMALFTSVNQKYFQGKMHAPRLVWSARKSVRRLGYYHPDTDTITISQCLDQAQTPRYAAEYIMYHEMLHKHLGLKRANSRRMAHTSTFKQMEKQFTYYKEAEAFIAHLGKKRNSGRTPAI